MNGEEIKYIRDQLSLTREGLADLLRVSSSTISKWENNRAKPLPAQRERLEKLRVYVGNVPDGVDIRPPKSMF